VPLLFLWRQGSLIFQVIPHLLAPFDRSSLQLGYGRGEGAPSSQDPSLVHLAYGYRFSEFLGHHSLFFSLPRRHRSKGRYLRVVIKASQDLFWFSRNFTCERVAKFERLVHIYTSIYSIMIRSSKCACWLGPFTVISPQNYASTVVYDQIGKRPTGEEAVGVRGDQDPLLIHSSS